MKKEKGWEFISIAVDLHDTIVEGKHTLGNDGAAYFPNALEVLKRLSQRNDIKLILWTSSHQEALVNEFVYFESLGISFDYVNENPACPTTTLSNFDKKFYFNILLDDKAGFEGKTDWFIVEEELRRIGEW